MSLSNPDFKYTEANHFLAVLLHLRLLRNDTRSCILPTNVQLFAYPYTGRLKAYTFDFKEIEAVKFDVDNVYGDYNRYIVIPMTVSVNRDGVSSAELFAAAYGGKDADYDSAVSWVDSQLVVQHQMAVIIDRKTRVGSLIDVNYSPWTSYYNEKESLSHQTKHDVLLQSVETFFKQNDALVEFQASLPGIDSEGRPTVNPWTRQSIVQFERFDALYFARDLIMSEAEPGAHVGTCVPSTYLMIEWLVNGGGVNERLSMLRKENTSLHALVLEYAQTAVETVYPVEILGLPRGSKLDFHAVMNDPEPAGENVVLAMQGFFEAQISSSYIMRVFVENSFAAG